MNELIESAGVISSLAFLILAAISFASERVGVVARTVIAVLCLAVPLAIAAALAATGMPMGMRGGFLGGVLLGAALMALWAAMRKSPRMNRPGNSWIGILVLVTGGLGWWTWSSLFGVENGFGFTGLFAVILFAVGIRELVAIRRVPRTCGQSPHV